MDMEDFLTGVGVAVGDEPITAFSYTESCRNFRHGPEDGSHDGAVAPVDVIEGGDVLPGNDEHVLGRSGMDVLEGDAGVVFVDSLGGDLAIEDLAKKTLGHDDHLQSSGLSRPVPARQLRYGKFGLLMLALLIGPACASVTQPKDNDLAAIVKRFHHDLRWKYNKDAALRALPKYSADFRDRLEDLKKDLSITSYEVRKVKLDQDGKQAEIKVYLKFFLMPSTVVKEIKLDEVWKLIDGAWFISELKGSPFDFPSEEKKQTEKKADDTKSHAAPAKVKEVFDEDPDG